MYQIDPNRAATELYGAGKGEAQIFDTSTQENALRYHIAQKAAADAAKLKKQHDIEEQNKALALAGGNFHPSDQPEVEKKTKDYYDTVKKYSQPNGEISQQGLQDLAQKKTDIVNFMNLSKNRFDQFKQAHEHTLNSGATYDPVDIQNGLKAEQQPSYNPETGKYDFSVRYGARPVIPLEEMVRKDAGQYLNQLKDKNQQGRTIKNTEEDAAKQAELFVQPLSHKLELERRLTRLKESGQLESTLSKLDPKYANNIVDQKGNIKEGGIENYAKALFAKEYKADTRLPEPAANLSLGYKKEQEATNAVFDPNTNSLVLRNPKKDEIMDVEIGGENIRIKSPKVEFDPKDRTKIVGGSYIIAPTPAQAKINSDIESDNRQNKGIRKSLIAKLDPQSEDYNYAEEVKKIEMQYPDQPIPYPERVKKTTDPSEIEAITKQAFGKSPQDIVSGKDREGVNFSEVESKTDKGVSEKYTINGITFTANEIADKAKKDGMTPERYITVNKAKPVGLKSSNEKTIGGHSYTFDELKQLGKKAGKSDKEIQDYWDNLK